MAQQTINIGAAPNDGTGDTLRDAMDKCNDNFTELYAGAGTPTAITVANEAADTTCFPLFVTAATGDLGPKTNAGLAFDSSTGMLTATGFTGPLTGTADAANALKSATTTVGVSAATAPSSGQVLTATSGTAATWQTPASTSPGGSSGAIQYNNAGSFGGSILTQGTNTISQLNSTNTQTYYLYGTDDGGTNYRRLYIKANDTSGDFRIAVEGAGTGASSNYLKFMAASTGTVAINIQDYATIIKNTYIDAVGIDGNDASNLSIAGGLRQTGYQEISEMTAPSAPAANKVRIYAEDNGSGKTRLMALFNTGAAQQIAIEP